MPGSGGKKLSTKRKTPASPNKAPTATGLAKRPANEASASAAAPTEEARDEGIGWSFMHPKGRGEVKAGRGRGRGPGVQPLAALRGGLAAAGAAAETPAAAPSRQVSRLLNLMSRGKQEWARRGHGEGSGSGELDFAAPSIQIHLGFTLGFM